MKLLIVTQYYWPENFRINDLAQGLKNKGWDITVLTGMPNYPQGSFFKGYGFFGPFNEVQDGIRIIRVPLYPRGRGRSIELILNYFSFAFFGSLFSPLFFFRRPDLIFVFQPSPITTAIPAIFIRLVCRRPLWLWIQDLWPESLSATGAIHSPRILSAVKRLVHFIYHRCDRILIQSQAFETQVRGFNYPAPKIFYFPNSSEALYRPTEKAEAEANVPAMPDGFRVMFAGNIGAAQDFETILDAATLLKSHKHIHWMIIGDGRMAPWVKEERAKRELTENVHLLGSYPIDKMPSFFALADALLVILRRQPIFAMTIPGKTQSYLACGKPIIAATDGEGNRIVTEANAGLAVPSQDPKALAQAVLTLSETSFEERVRMGQRGREYYLRNFDRDMLLDKLDGWISPCATPPDSHSRCNSE